MERGKRVVALSVFLLAAAITIALGSQLAISSVNDVTAKATVASALIGLYGVVFVAVISEV